MAGAKGFAMKQVSNIMLAVLALPVAAGCLALASWALREPDAPPVLPPIAVAPSPAIDLVPVMPPEAAMPVAAPAAATPAPAPGEPMLDPVPALDPTPLADRDAGQAAPPSAGPLSGMAEVPAVR
jgi:hypothetical protein